MWSVILAFVLGVMGGIGSLSGGGLVFADYALRMHNPLIDKEKLTEEDFAQVGMQIFNLKASTGNPIIDYENKLLVDVYTYLMFNKYPALAEPINKINGGAKAVLDRKNELEKVFNAPISLPIHIDIAWMAYRVTGEQKYIRRILEVICKDDLTLLSACTISTGAVLYNDMNLIIFPGKLNEAETEENQKKIFLAALAYNSILANERVYFDVSRAIRNISEKNPSLDYKARLGKVLERKKSTGKA